MRAISMERTSRTVIDATTSSRLSFSLTLLRRMSRIGTAGPPSCLGLGYAPALCCPASAFRRFCGREPGCPELARAQYIAVGIAEPSDFGCSARRRPDAEFILRQAIIAVKGDPFAA